MAALCLAKARSSMTAPMKLDRSGTSPMARPSVSAMNWSRIFFQTDLATYAREAAEHFWPWNSKAPRSIATRATSGWGRGVDDDEVLAAGLADDAGVGAVLRDVGADLAPEVLE